MDKSAKLNLRHLERMGFITSRPVRLFDRRESGATEQPRPALLFEPVALALNVERGRVVQQAVQDGGGQDRIVEGLAPIQEALVGGDDQAGALVATHHQTEEQAGFELRERQVADLVDDEHLGVGELLQGALQAVLVEGLDQTGHQGFQG